MSRFNPHYPNATAVYEAASNFKQRCLLDQYSLFLDKQVLWTPERFQVLIDNYVRQPDAGEGNFYEKMAIQLAACDPLDVALMAEVFWSVQLGPHNMRPAVKRNRVERLWNINPPIPFSEDSPFLDEAALSGLGSAGPGYNNFLWMEIAFAVEAFAAFTAKDRIAREALLADGQTFARWLDSVPSAKGRQFYHTLCHVLFPDEFERIFSQGNKNQIARHFKIWEPRMAEDRPLQDASLLNLRNRLEAMYPGQGVDYYAPPVGPVIKKTTPDAAAPNVAEVEVTEPATDYLSEDAVDMPSVVRLADNLILYGPPGSGKTHEMQARMRQAYDNGEDFEFVSFHPSYGYEDFIGGLRPLEAKEGGIVVAFHKGPFMRICEEAHSAPTQQFTLFIDEINRANVAKVFGELITLIEPSKRVRAGSQPNDNGAWVRLPGNDALFGVPDNLNIVATMNTADRSIAMMDIALRRRFRFEECPADPAKIEPAFVGDISLPTLLQRINDRLEYLLDKDHAIGHAFFMGLQSPDDVRQVLAQRIVPLLQEYFFEDLAKVRLVLTGTTKGSIFFAARSLRPTELFPGGRQEIGSESRVSYRLTDPSTWQEADIIALYEGPAVNLPGSEGLSQDV